MNFRMLTLARESRGLTQSELVKKIPNLTQGNYSRMEKGLLSVPDETLFNISKVLDFPISFFSCSEPIAEQAEFYYRKRVSMPRKVQIKIEANFDLLRLWIDLLLRDVDIPDCDLPQLRVEGKNNPSEIARIIRYSMGLHRGPIDNIVYNLEKNGIIVYFLMDSPEKFDGTTIITKSGVKVIIVNGNIPNDRKRFTIAHELGHIVMHLPFSPILDPDCDVEREANEFASEFLMPELDIRRDFVNFKFRFLNDLKQYWKVSKSSLIMKAYDLGYIQKSKYTSMMIELSRMGERKNESGNVSIDNPVLLKQVLNTYFNKLDYTLDEIMKILSISQHDMETKILCKNKSSIMKIVI